MKAPYIGRFAPSPTGPLHLGSLATALGSHLDAKLHQGQWIVRIEDIDQGRCKPEFSQSILQALHAHGLHSDQTVWTQSERHAHYENALAQLTQQGLTYPCACNRKTIEQHNTIRETGQNRIYPGLCRQGLKPHQTAHAIRFKCPTLSVEWKDHHLGFFSDNLEQSSGDFVLKRADGFWAYHLVVVVDDIASQVTHIVRGEDLCNTTARQITIYQALNAPTPAYWHLPVILASDGQKLSKQTGAAAINLATPIQNLNIVWTHFQLPPLHANTVSAWLEQAIPVWGNYREQTKNTKNV